MDVEAALAYARKHALEALVVARGDEVVAQEYASGFRAGSPHPLYSGTKSFWGVAAVYAQRDGLLELDELAADTIASWREDPWKRRVTLRMLLSLTSGFGFGGLGSAVPPYPRALGMALKNEPGTTFTYGGIPLQVFGAVLAQKLAPKTPHDYLRERVLDPAGIQIAFWRKLPDGTQPLPTGASMTAAQWLGYGKFVLRERAALAQCFVGTKANARYGLGWWVRVTGAPDDLFYASGSGGQAMYVVPSLDLVAVHFGKSASYKHDAMLKRLFSGG
ncbi:MAG TPA: serine hydrolase [Candidatus Baltobacteraceae bacterium]|jgi:CubicO group peptidase (beta-lactamase class C family)|nr:serine hydrolase [Candidatus Baltobacteraceae bacterium]